MRRHFFNATLLAGLIGALVLPHARARAAEYTNDGSRFSIDASHTRVSLEVRSLGFYTYRARFNGATGFVDLDSQAGRGSLDVVIDARSIEAGSHAMEKFMRGSELLDVAHYPEIVYRARRILFAGGRPERIDGELTLRGVTRSVSLIVTGYDCSFDGSSLRQRCAMDASAAVKRSEFGMTGYLGYLPVTSDEVKIAIRAEGTAAGG